MSETTKCAECDGLYWYVASDEGGTSDVLCANCGEPWPNQHPLPVPRTPTAATPSGGCPGCGERPCECSVPATPLPAPDHGAAREIAESFIEEDAAFVDSRRRDLARAYIERDDYLAKWVHEGVCNRPCCLAPHGEAVPDTEWLIAQREEARANVRGWKESPPEQGNHVEQMGYWRGVDHALGLVMARRVNLRPAPAARVTSEMVEAGEPASVRVRLTCPKGHQRSIKLTCDCNATASPVFDVARQIVAELDCYSDFTDGAPEEQTLHAIWKRLTAALSAGGEA